jgi:hypothetical protein
VVIAAWGGNDVGGSLNTGTRPGAGILRSVVGQQQWDAHVVGLPEAVDGNGFPRVLVLSGIRPPSGAPRPGRRIGGEERAALRREI